MTRTVQGRKFGQNGGPPLFKARHFGNQPIPLLYLLFNDTELCSALGQKLLLLRAELAYVLKPSSIGKPIPPQLKHDRNAAHRQRQSGKQQDRGQNEIGCFHVVVFRWVRACF